MANTGKISVELKLLLDNLRKQAQEAAKTVQTEFAKAGAAGNVSASTSKAVTEQTKLTSSIKETTKALTAAQQARKKLLDEWRKSRPEAKVLKNGEGTRDTSITPAVPEMGGPWENPFKKAESGSHIDATKKPTAAEIAKQKLAEVNEELRIVQIGLKKMQIARIASEQETIKKRLELLRMSTPQLMMAGLSKLKDKIGSSLPKMPSISGASFKTAMPAIAAGVGTAVGGPLGGAVAGLLTKANPAVAAVTAVMTALRMAVSETAEAFKRAHDTYIRSMTSGFGLKMQATRQLLSQVIGVSENDIFQFGAAIGQFNDKLNVARNTIIETTPALAYTTMNWNVMMENIRAAWMQFAAAVAPAINRIEDFVSSLVKLSILAGVPNLLGEIVDGILEGITRVAAAIMLPIAGFELIFVTIKDGIANAVQFIINQLARIPGASHLGIEKGEMPGFGKTKEAANDFAELFKVAFMPSDKKKEQSQPVASMKQMPASSWERMGLVIGGSGGVNYNQQIAANTKHSNTLIEKLIASNKFTIAQPAGMPATP